MRSIVRVLVVITPRRQQRLVYLIRCLIGTGGVLIVSVIDLTRSVVRRCGESLCGGCRSVVSTTEDVFRVGADVQVLVDEGIVFLTRLVDVQVDRRGDGFNGFGVGVGFVGRGGCWVVCGGVVGSGCGVVVGEGRGVGCGGGVGERLRGISGCCCGDGSSSVLCRGIEVLNVPFQVRPRLITHLLLLNHHIRFHRIHNIQPALRPFIAHHISILELPAISIPHNIQPQLLPQHRKHRLRGDPRLKALLYPPRSQNRPQHMYEHLVHQWVLLDQLIDRLVRILLKNRHEFSKESLELEIIEHRPHRFCLWGEHDIEVEREDSSFQVGEETVVVSLVSKAEDFEVDNSEVRVGVVDELLDGAVGRAAIVVEEFGEFSAVFEERDEGVAGLGVRERVAVEGEDLEESVVGDLLVFHLGLIK